MKSIFRATAILGSSSVITILAGLAAAKANALLVGTSGVGLFGLFNSLLGLSALIAGMGIGTGLVRSGAAALERGDTRQVLAYRKATWLLYWLFGSIMFVAFVLLREPISRYLLGSVEYAWAVPLMGLAMLFSLASGMQTSILNTFHRVGALAKTAALNSVIGVTLGITIVWQWGEPGIPVAVIVGTIVHWLVSRYFLSRNVNLPRERLSREEILGAARHLLRFGAPYTASIMVGSGIQLSLPLLVLHQLGQDNVGIYRAAAAISLQYLAFLLAAMAQDYYPRISAAAHDADKLNLLVNQQHRLVMVIAVPMILGVMAFAPFIVPLIYSPEFLPAVQILEWQLIGDLLKFSSWTMAYIILARSGSSIYFITELISGITLLVSSWLLMSWLGLTGLGMGHLVTYSVYFVVCYFVIRREIQFTWSSWNIRVLLIALGLAGMIRALPLLGLEIYSLAFTLMVTIGAALFSAYVVLKEFKGLRQEPLA